MALEHYASVAEIVGVLLVIASLLYVAKQLKQTTNMMRVTASNERVEREYDILNSLIENREVAEYWVKGESDFPDTRTNVSCWPRLCRNEWSGARLEQRSVMPAGGRLLGLRPNA